MKRKLIDTLKAAGHYEALSDFLIEASNKKYAQATVRNLYNTLIYMVEGNIDWFESHRKAQPCGYLTALLPAIMLATEKLKEWVESKESCCVSDDELKRLSLHLANQRLILCVDILKDEKHRDNLPNNQTTLDSLCRILREDYISDDQRTHGVSFNWYLEAIDQLTHLFESQPALNVGPLLEVLTAWLTIAKEYLKLHHQEKMLAIIKSVNSLFLNRGQLPPLDLHSAYLGVLMQCQNASPDVESEFSNVIDKMNVCLAEGDRLTAETRLRAYHYLYEYFKERNDVRSALIQARAFSGVYASCQDSELGEVYESIMMAMILFDSENEVLLLDMAGSLEKLDIQESSFIYNPFELISPQTPSSALSGDEDLGMVIRIPSEKNPIQDFTFSDSSLDEVLASIDEQEVEAILGNIAMMQEPLPHAGESDFQPQPRYRLVKNSQQSDIRAILTDWDKTLCDRELEGNEGKKRDVLINKEIFYLFSIAKDLGIALRILTARSSQMDQGLPVKAYDAKAGQVRTLSGSGRGIPYVLAQNNVASLFPEENIIYCDLYQRVYVSGVGDVYDNSFTMDRARTKLQGFLSFSKVMQIPAANIAVMDDEPRVLADLPAEALKIIVPAAVEKEQGGSRRYKGFDAILEILMQIILYNDSIALGQRLRAAHDMMASQSKFPKAKRHDYCEDLLSFIEKAKDRADECAEFKRRGESSQVSAAKRVKLDEAAPSRSSGSLGLFSGSSSNHSRSGEHRLERRSYK